MAEPLPQLAGCGTDHRHVAEACAAWGQTP